MARSESPCAPRREADARGSWAAAVRRREVAAIRGAFDSSTGPVRSGPLVAAIVAGDGDLVVDDGLVRFEPVSRADGRADRASGDRAVRLVTRPCSASSASSAAEPGAERSAARRV